MYVCDCVCKKREIDRDRTKPFIDPCKCLSVS